MFSRKTVPTEGPKREEFSHVEQPTSAIYSHSVNFMPKLIGLASRLRDGILTYVSTYVLVKVIEHLVPSRSYLTLPIGG
jgi:hypothetical protein